MSIGVQVTLCTGWSLCTKAVTCVSEFSRIVVGVVAKFWIEMLASVFANWIAKPPLPLCVLGEVPGRMLIEFELHETPRMEVV